MNDPREEQQHQELQWSNFKARMHHQGVCTNSAVRQLWITECVSKETGVIALAQEESPTHGHGDLPKARQTISEDFTKKKKACNSSATNSNNSAPIKHKRVMIGVGENLLKLGERLCAPRGESKAVVSASLLQPRRRSISRCAETHEKQRRHSSLAYEKPSIMPSGVDRKQQRRSSVGAGPNLQHSQDKDMRATLEDFFVKKERKSLKYKAVQWQQRRRASIGASSTMKKVGLHEDNFSITGEDSSTSHGINRMNIDRLLYPSLATGGKPNGVLLACCTTKQESHFHDDYKSRACFDASTCFTRTTKKYAIGDKVHVQIEFPSPIDNELPVYDEDEMPPPAHSPPAPEEYYSDS